LEKSEYTNIFVFMGLIQYNTKWTKINHEEVLKLHSMNYTVNEICLQLRTTEHVVNKILNLHGIKGGTKIDRLKDKYQDIIESYQKHGKLTIVAKEFNTTENLVDKVLKLHNVSKREVIKELNTQEVIDYYEKIHIVKPVAEKFGVSNSVILKILHSNNVRVSKIKYTEQQIIEKYLELKTLVATCNELGISETYLSRVLKEHNIELQVLKRKEIGDVFGKLTIIEETNPTVSPRGHRTKKFILRCECGTIVTRSSNKLSNDKSSHCGCVILERKRKREEEKRIRKENYEKRLLERKLNKPKKEPRDKYFVGSIKGRLTILSFGNEHWSERTVLCKCECGSIKEMPMSNFYGCNSCGCLSENRIKASTTHGLSPKNDKYRRNWYDRWRGMIKRCYDPKMHAYPNYGGRGIQVCDRWREPNGVGCKNYIEDIHNILGPQPSPIHSLDRIDNDGNYEISNLRWATLSEQAKNQRRYLK
jgi:hypothetical protein